MWAFGCVLFEMLTGARAFGGSDVADTLAAVLRSEPDWARLPADTPEPVRRVLRRRLSKNPKERLADASAARLDLEEARAAPAPGAPAVPARTTSWREPLAWTLLAACAAAGV